MSSDKPAILGGTPAFDEVIQFVRPWVPEPADVARMFRDVRRSRWLTNNGPQVVAFEEELCRFLGVSHCAAVANGTLGLMLALKSLGVAGKTVVPSFTFAATGHAVEWSGCAPVFADVDPVYWTLDPECVATVLHQDDDVEALLGVHVFGNPCEHEALGRLAASHGVKLLYDAAHAFGTRACGGGVGALGQAAVFSFHATKLFHTGEGGAVVSDREAVIASVRELRNFGFVRGADCDRIGTNAKLAEIPAAMGRALLGEVPRHIRRRREMIQLYRSGLQSLPGIGFHTVRPGVEHNGSYFPITIASSEAGLSRDNLFAALLAENIVTRPYFNPPLHRMCAYAGKTSGALPVSERLSREVLCLPVYSDMEKQEAQKVVEALLRIMRFAPAVRSALDNT